jgi:hypothetical protein
MEDPMIEENKTHQLDKISPGVIIITAILLLLSLGGLIYFFITPVQ